MNTLDYARLLAKRLSALEKSDKIDRFAPQILDLMQGCPYAVWELLDEKPGLFNYMDDRFYMLRRVRNHPGWGRKMFDGFTKEQDL